MKGSTSRARKKKKEELFSKIPEKWQIQFDKKFGYLYQRDSISGVSTSVHEEVKQFIKEELEISYFRGFNDGADVCGQQAEEVRGCELRELERTVILFEDYLPVEFLASFFKKLGKIKKQ